MSLQNAKKTKSYKVDEIVSKVVGKKVYATDPKLLRWVADELKHSRVTNPERSSEAVRKLRDLYK